MATFLVNPSDLKREGLEYGFENGWALVWEGGEVQTEGAAVETALPPPQLLFATDFQSVCKAKLTDSRCESGQNKCLILEF